MPPGLDDLAQGSAHRLDGVDNPPVSGGDSQGAPGFADGGIFFMPLTVRPGRGRIRMCRFPLKSLHPGGMW